MRSAPPLSLPVDRTVVLVIECQNDLIHESNIGAKGIGAALAAAVEQRGVIARIAAVIAAARQVGVPIIYVNKETRPGMATGKAPIFQLSRGHAILREGSWGAEVHPALAPQDGDYVIRRLLGVDASYGSGLFPTVQVLQRSVLVTMGVSTNFAVEGTVRGAVNRLLEVVVPEDCCAGVPDAMHRFSVEHILALLATVTTSAAVVDALRSPAS